MVKVQLPSSINKNIVKSIIACVVILQILMYFWLPGYHTFVYGACLILLIIAGTISFNINMTSLQNNMMGTGSTGLSSTSTMLYRILYMYLMFLPLGFLQYIQLRYKDEIDHKISENTRYKTLLYLVTFGLIIQTIVFYHGLLNHSTTSLYGSVILSLLNLLLSGLLWRDVAFFVTDGFTISK